MRAVAAFAPGRVNLIGEHTDYNGGLALPFAIAQGVTVTATPVDGDTVQAHARELGAHDSFELADPRPARGWRAFVRGTVAELAAAGYPVTRGVALEITSDLPIGAGLSSSAALAVALAIALIGEAEPMDRTALARLCSRVENEWVGARTGLLDQLASLYGAPDRALLIDFRSLALTPVALRLGDHTLVTLDSGERHAHAGRRGYNERREECARACELLGVGSLRDADPDSPAQLPSPLDRRVRHVLDENRRVEAAVAALASGDLDQLGRLLDGSHESLRDSYEVSTSAVEEAVARLKRAGAIGARLIGGGFGGHVLGLMAPGAVAPDGAREVRPGPGARLLGR